MTKQSKKEKTQEMDMEDESYTRAISMRANRVLLDRLEAVANHPKQRRKLGSLIKILVEDQLPYMEAELGIRPKK